MERMIQQEPTLMEVADAIGHSRVALNMVWTLVAGFMVMFMQAGFAMVETGFTRAKNVAHTMSMTGWTCRKWASKDMRILIPPAENRM